MLEVVLPTAIRAVLKSHIAIEEDRDADSVTDEDLDRRIAALGLKPSWVDVPVDRAKVQLLIYPAGSWIVDPLPGRIDFGGVVDDAERGSS